MRSAEKVDVLIVGAGAAGGVIAHRALAAGKSVLLLEAGAERGLQDLTSSQIWSRRLKWSGAPVEEEGNHKIGFAFNSGSGTGGSAMHHYAVWPRLHNGDFSVRSDHDTGLDWPFPYAALRPYYDRVQATVGISGDAEAERWRPAGSPYPLPPLPVFAQGAVLARGFAAKDMHTAPIPLAVNSRPFGNRLGCLFDGWCDAGCPIGALANPLVTYLGWALRAGAGIRHQAEVVRLTHNARGSRVTGARYVDAAGNAHTVAADHVVLAASAVQNARLLLNSRSDKHPAGIGNQHDRVGRYLMTHPATSLYGLFTEETHPHVGATGGQLISQERYDRKSELPGAFGSYQWLIAQALKPNDLLGIANTRPDISGAQLEPFMQRAVRHMATMTAVGEDIAQADNRVTLSENRDGHGMPLARAVHNLDPRSAALADAAVTEGIAILKAAGAQEAWAGPRVAMHILGGTVMGQNERDAVADGEGRCFGVDNLYITGSGLFPSSGAVNPTFTIHALAERTADAMFGAPPAAAG